MLLSLEGDVGCLQMNGKQYYQPRWLQVVGRPKDGQEIVLIAPLWLSLTWRYGQPSAAIWSSGAHPNLVPQPDFHYLLRLVPGVDKNRKIRHLWLYIVSISDDRKLKPSLVHTNLDYVSRVYRIGSFHNLPTRACRTP